MGQTGIILQSTDGLKVMLFLFNTHGWLYLLGDLLDVAQLKVHLDRLTNSFCDHLTHDVAPCHKPNRTYPREFP